SDLLFVPHQFVNLRRQIAFELSRVKRFKRALFHLRERNEKSGLPIYYDFLNSPNLARNHRGFAGHGFEINNAKRFVDRWTTENCRMGVELNHARFIEHLIDPDYAVPRAPRLLNRALHFSSDLRRVGRARTKHHLEIFVHELDRADKVNNALLPRNPTDEQQIRLFRIDPEFAEGILRLHRAIFIEIDSIVDYM